MAILISLELSEKEIFEGLVLKHGSERKANRAIKEARKKKEEEKRNKRYNRFVLRMRAKSSISDIPKCELLEFLGVSSKELTGFYENTDRTRKIKYKYAYTHCLLFAKNFKRAKMEMILSGNPPTGDKREDKLLALLELITETNLSPRERLQLAKKYMYDFEINF